MWQWHHQRKLMTMSMDQYCHLHNYKSTTTIHEHPTPPPVARGSYICGDYAFACTLEIKRMETHVHWL